MFKKPLSRLKTSAPLRGSDRRKLKQSVVALFSLPPEAGDTLVPEGILSIKFNTHFDEPGVAYLSPEGDPLWFTVGKRSDELVPTVYTLWKRPNLLPFLTTPAAVIPILVGGADLMIPGVVHNAPGLKEGQLVAVSQYTHGESPTLSVPLAVGRMALPSDKIEDDQQEKGKAVLVLHVWKDFLWDMGSKPDMPKQMPFSMESASFAPPDGNGTHSPEAEAGASEEIPISTLSITPSSYTPAEISDLLQKSLLQALSTTLSTVPTSTFPLSTSVFYETYVLPYRPAFPHSVLRVGGDEHSPGNPRDITVKASTHKSLTAFMKAMEKASLLTLKAPPKHGQQTELMVTGVNLDHPSVDAHASFPTVRDLETRAAKKAQNEERQKEAEKAERRVEAKELWKAHLRSVELIEAFGGSLKTLYELSEVRTMLNEYIAKNGLVNPREQAYINLDAVLSAAIAPKKSKTETPPVDFMKRDELARNVLEQMQPWYEVKAPGKDPVTKKGALKPIRVEVKIRQGRKASTLITGFEPFGVLDGEDMAEELQKICAGSTSVSPRVGGKPGLEVLVQGKQSKAVVDYLMDKGISKKWVEVVLAG